jgi:hypothetical protein
MPRILIALLALLSLTGAARSDTPPGRTPDAHATLFNQARLDSPILRLMPSRASSHATPLSCCKVCSIGKACGNT